MRRLTVSTIAVLFVSAAGSFVGPSAVAHPAASHYHFRVVRVKSASGHRCGRAIVNGIADNGTVLGTGYCGRPFAFTRTATGHTKRYRLPAKRAKYTYASNIASNGIIALVGTNKRGPEKSFLLSPNGKLTPVRDPSAHGHGTVVNGVNKYGEAVGVYCLHRSCVRQQAFIYSAGSYSDFVLPIGGAVEATLSGVTNSGELAGSYFTGTSSGSYQERGFTYRNGQAHPINAPGAGQSKKYIVGTFILGIANNGTLCGDRVDSHNRSRGFVKIHGKRRVISRYKSKKSETEILAINRHGEFGGHAKPATSKHYLGFLGRL